jgi:endonuclease/exonuclease/phosphatase family metal-dependent hydrolase
MRFSVAFLNCGGRKTTKWDDIASTLHTAVGDIPHIVGLCEVYDNEDIPKLVTILRTKTGKQYVPVFSKAEPASPRLGILADTSLGHLQPVGDDESYRHGRDWRHWLAGRVDLYRPGTKAPSLQQLVVVVNHWTSMKSGRQDTTANREILAWEVGNWMCSKDANALQVLSDSKGYAIPVYRQPSIAMGDFNCEPGSPELRSNRKFTLQAMRNEPSLWKTTDMANGTKALLYDLSWRKLTAAHAAALPGTYNRRGDLHSPAMLDRILVSQDLWNGPDMHVNLDDNGQAMRIVPAVEECSDHAAIAITVETK